MSRKSTAAYSVFIIVTVCLLFAALLVLPRKQDHSSNTSSDYVQTHENRDDKKPMNSQSHMQQQKICLNRIPCKEIVKKLFKTKPRVF